MRRTLRRDLLRCGVLGSAVWATRGSMASPTGAAPQRRAKSVLMLYLFGGPGQLDTFDMKPDAPEQVRGELRPIATSVPGLHICELLPRVAKVMDRLTVVRTMSHNRTVHGGAVVYALTGELNRDPGIPGVRGPDASVADHPNLGSAVRKLGPREVDIPNAVTLPFRMIDGQGREPPGQWAGMLGKLFNPWLVESDPNSSHFQVASLAVPADFTARRLQGRRQLLDLVDRQQRSLHEFADVTQMSGLFEQAVSLLASPRARKAFDLASEPEALRDKYGRNTFGQACILGRRLVEAEVPFIQVNMGASLGGEYGWDTHSNTFPSMRKSLCPRFDAAFAALVEDLDSRGLLEDTLLLVNSEFGRSPTISRNGGRDHWPNCYSLLFGGAGVQRGAVIGKSDSRAAYPLTQSFSPADVAATVYQSLGIRSDAEIHDAEGRPISLNRGRFMSELFA